jgi:DNA repair protein RecN (Recombination protein N)
LLDSLGFVLGWRGRADLVRTGAEQGEVVAEFDLPAGHAGHAVLDEAGLSAEDGLILRRINTRDGRKTAWINDRRVSGEVLRALSETLVELHGQHDDRGLLNPRGHMDILDTFAGTDAARVKVRKAWRDYSAAEKTLVAAENALAAVREEEEFLRHAVSELEALDPQTGEEAELDQRRRAMQGAEKIREDVMRAHQSIGYDGAEGRMGDALRWLEDSAEGADGQLDDAINALGRAMAELSDAQAGIETSLNAMAFNPSELEEVEERLFAIRGLARKYDVLADELGTFTAEQRTKLDHIDGGEDDIMALTKAVMDARATYDIAAGALTAKRQKSAASLDRAMAKQLAPLKMERAVFTTDVTLVPAGPDGCDAVAFTVATNPGAPSGPLNKIASGGELSRFLLALKVCLTSDDAGLTMIFDEIDRGVGGATADAVGRRLQGLAEGGQVLVVTHSPQVAALGAHHMRVQKSVKKGMTLSTVVPLDDTERVDEIARMISGDTISDEARGAARALLVG